MNMQTMNKLSTIVNVIIDKLCSQIIESGTEVFYSFQKDKEFEKNDTNVPNFQEMCLIFQALPSQSLLNIVKYKIKTQ